MSRLILSLGAVIALTAIFVIPSAYSPTHIAKASTCSATNSIRTHIIPLTTSGSCASTSSAGYGAGLKQGQALIGGSQSSCASHSVAINVDQPSQRFSSNGAVSCSSHSP